MSRENVEVVRRFAERWERSDWEGMAELADPEVEMHATVGGVEEGRVRRGVDAIRRDYEAADETWDEHRIETERVIDAGDRSSSCIASSCAGRAAAWSSSSRRRC